MTYSHATVHGTTIGSKRLNVRVRYVYVCFPQAYCHQAKEFSLPMSPIEKPLFDHSMNIASNLQPLEKYNINSLRPLVLLSSTCHHAYTRNLSTRSSSGILTILRLGNLILELAWRLDAFSAYPSRA